MAGTDSLGSDRLPTGPRNLVDFHLRSAAVKNVLRATSVPFFCRDFHLPLRCSRECSPRDFSALALLLGS
eukprot:bmy_20160T0